MVESLIEKGNVVVNDKYETHALVLAVTKDGKRAKLHLFGKDQPVWHPVTWYSIVEADAHTCWKCSGSGLYYFGGMVLNGVYQGKTGPCFGCVGKGVQTNEDRTRCHYYWHSGASRHADLMPDDFNDGE